MAKFAVIENNNILNTIIADSKAIAEQVTNKTCIEYTVEPAEPGGTYVNNKFIKQQPYPSWVRVGESDWKSPVDYPKIDLENPKSYRWDEATTSWIEVEND
jgi:hypothetical protein